LWYEIEPELSELDEYGGGDYDTMDDVGERLYQLVGVLNKVTLDQEDREDLFWGSHGCGHDQCSSPLIHLQ